MRCDLCGSDRVSFEFRLQMQSCFDCEANKTTDGWRHLTSEEIATLVKAPTACPILYPELTEQDAARWWNDKTPKLRYDAMGYSDWPEEIINTSYASFASDWNSLPADVRRDILLGIKNGMFKR